MNKRVVFVYDDTTRRQRYISCFYDRGFDVDSTTDRRHATRHYGIGQADLVIVDADLGQNDPDGGFQLCRELRTHWPALPIIILGKHDNEADMLSAYRLGADEFLSEQTKPDYLAARSHALLARLDLLLQSSRPSTDYGLGRLRIKRPTLNAYWDEHALALTLKQVRMLVELVEACGEVCSLSQLMKAAQIHVQPNTVTATVTRMRRIFQDIDPAFDAIESVHGLGYRWKDLS